MVNSLNLILKDFNNNDNLINIINNKNDFEFNCTCGKKYCYHLDYIIHDISNDINNKNVDKLYNIIGFDSLETMLIEQVDNYGCIHTVILNFIKDEFKLKCSCENDNCFVSKYSIINLISNYLKKKELHYSCGNNESLTKDFYIDLEKLKI